jgi:hypothetical protein
MASLTRLSSSRDGWRVKATSRHREIRSLRQALSRRDEKIAKAELEIAKLGKELESERNRKSNELVEKKQLFLSAMSTQ